MLFELTDVTYSRGGRRVLDGVTAALPVGASCLFGPSGSGKSTVLRLLDRLIDPESGVVRYEGRDVRERDPLALRREVALVPQLPALVEGTVGDNVALGPRLAGHSYDSRSALELAGLDPSFAVRPADRLSVGEQQRVMLARGLALQPRVRLLDEPTSALDAEATAAVERTLARLRARTSISLVLVTHDLEQAARVAERIVCIDAGRVVREGPAAEIAAAERERHVARAEAGGPATEVADAAGSGPATEPMGRGGTQP
ncbi:MAG: ABC transporter ATP-binding protein [Solirubrobacterales bacterium]